MIDPKVIKAFKKSVHEKTAGPVGLLGGAAALGGLGVLGAAGLGVYGLGSSVMSDMQYGRAERMEEKARRLRAMQIAKNMPRYNSRMQGLGGMHG